jgi:hypothetical protein
MIDFNWSFFPIPLVFLYFDFHVPQLCGFVNLKTNKFITIMTLLFSLSISSTSKERQMFISIRQTSCWCAPLEKLRFWVTISQNKSKQSATTPNITRLYGSTRQYIRSSITWMLNDREWSKSSWETTQDIFSTSIRCFVLDDSRVKYIIKKKSGGKTEPQSRTKLM